MRISPIDPILLASVQEAEGRTVDPEVLIRNAFAEDPRRGCELLFRQYYRALCSHAVRVLYSKAIAEDIVAEVFCQFYDNEAYRNITTSYRAYLYKAVRSRVYNYLRWQANRSLALPEAEGATGTTTANPEALLEFEEMYTHIQDAIRAMPAQRQKIYLLYRFEGKKYAEIAQELGISVRTVEAQLRNANLHLRDLLERHWGIILTQLFWLVF